MAVAGALLSALLVAAPASATTATPQTVKTSYIIHNSIYCKSAQGHTATVYFDGDAFTNVVLSAKITGVSGTINLQVSDGGLAPTANYSFSVTADGKKDKVADLGSRGIGGVGIRATFGYNWLGVAYYCTGSGRF